MKTFEFASPNATKRRVGLPGLYGSGLRAASRASISARRFLSRRICPSRILPACSVVDRRGVELALVGCDPHLFQREILDLALGQLLEEIGGPRVHQVVVTGLDAAAGAKSTGIIEDKIHGGL
jgi:hypothetical protein